MLTKIKILKPTTQVDSQIGWGLCLDVLMKIQFPIKMEINGGWEEPFELVTLEVLNAY